MRRYLLWVEYVGTGFRGFQKQPGLPTVQGALEAAILSLTGEQVSVSGAGRTDAGVHARSQAVALTLGKELEPGKLARGLNAVLPPGVSVREASLVPGDFDPRRDAEWREYRYLVLNRPSPSSVLGPFSYHHPFGLDWSLVSEACALVPGERDFSAFTVERGRHTVRRVMKCQVERLPWWEGLYSVVVRADSFLHKMVRILTGALVRVGSGKMGIDEFQSHLQGGEQICAEPLPAHGLFLWEVGYPEARLKA